MRRLRTRWIALAVGLVLVAFGVVLAVQHRSEPSVPRLVLEHAPAPISTAIIAKVEARCSIGASFRRANVS